MSVSQKSLDALPDFNNVTSIESNLSITSYHNQNQSNDHMSSYMGLTDAKGAEPRAPKVSRLSSIGFKTNITQATGKKTLSSYANEQLRAELNHNPAARGTSTHLTTLDHYTTDMDISKYRREYNKYQNQNKLKQMQDSNYDASNIESRVTLKSYQNSHKINKFFNAYSNYQSIPLDVSDMYGSQPFGITENQNDFSYEDEEIESKHAGTGTYDSINAVTGTFDSKNAGTGMNE